jgi:phosphohistidine phosphatase SixA
MFRERIMAMRCGYFCTLAGLLLLVACAATWFFRAANVMPGLLEKHGEQAFNMLAHWSRRDIAVLIRHVERCDRSEGPCLEGEDGISVSGREMAVKLGENIRKLLPLDDAIIFNSPVKRADQTARFMFGGMSNDKEWLREGCRNNLFREIFTNKADGKNLILVSHATCINELYDQAGEKLITMDIANDDTYGIAIFIALDKPAKQAHVLGYLYPGDWELLSGRKQQPGD